MLFMPDDSMLKYVDEGMQTRRYFGFDHRNVETIRHLPNPGYQAPVKVYRDKKYNHCKTKCPTINNINYQK